MRAAAARGLTHLAITDHDRIDGALAARVRGRARRPALTIIVGQEVRTLDGDLIAPVPRARRSRRGLAPAEAIAAVRAQGGLVGIPHPFDRFRGSLPAASGDASRDCERARPRRASTGSRRYNARLMVGDGNERAAAFAREHGLPGVAVSDAHTDARGRRRVRRARRRPVDARRAARGARRRRELVTGRASYFVGRVTPIAKVVQRARGRGRRRRPAGRGAAVSDDERPDQGASVSGRRRRERRRRPTPPSPTAAPASIAASATDAARPRRRRGAPPGLDRRVADQERRQGDRIDPDALSLGRRLRQPRTIISLVLPIILLVLFARRAARVPPRRAAGLILGANPLAAARRVRRLLPRLPAARPALGDPRPRHRLSAPRPRLDRDHLHLVAR